MPDVPRQDHALHLIGGELPPAVRKAADLEGVQQTHPVTYFMAHDPTLILGSIDTSRQGSLPQHRPGSDLL